MGLSSMGLRGEWYRSCALAGFVTLAQALGGVAAPAMAADKPPVPAAAKPPVPPPAPAPAKPPGMPSEPTAMTQAAAQAGVLSCAVRIDQVSKFLATDNAVSFLFLLPPPPRDQRMVTTAMEVDHQNAAPAYAGADFAATAQGCGASYETVTYWPLKCDDVFTRFYSKVRQAPALGKSIATLDAGGNARIFLMPAGAAGCITIKKELL
jgi:hypothetical protein